MSEFTPEEEKLIAPFFTNLDKNTFCLINLPEVVKGALFSRYSRTAKSLRRVLLDEFIMQPEFGFREIVGTAVESGVNQLIAIKKAEEFYDRVLVGYGDDSVAELGGANIACERVSNIATKALEDSRIGLSPLEKSTRYVRFDQKVNGEWQFLKEPAIMESGFADLYMETCSALFDLYSKLMDLMIAWVKERVPQADSSDRAYESACRAKACDILRGLLPASTLTNVGIYGNGRAFEYLLVKLYANPLAEMQGIAAVMQEELSKVIPSFVKRANDKYGRQMQAYLADTKQAMQNVADNLLAARLPQQVSSVTMVHHDPDAEVKIIVAMLYPHSHLPMHQLVKIVQAMDAEQRLNVIREYLHRRQNRRHKPGRAFENVHYTFDILGNFGMYRDLQRHRMLTQERQLLTCLHGYDMPQELAEAGFESEFRGLMQTAKETWESIAIAHPLQAQYIVPMAYRLRWYFTMSLREVYYLTELRSMQQGHPDYRKVAQIIAELVRQAHPALAEYMKFVDMNDYALARIEAEKKIDRKLEEIKKKYEG